MKKIILAFALAFALAISIFSQSAVNGNRTTTGAVDNSGAASTSPHKAGLSASIPATCTVGQTYFKTDATAGANVFGCTATNTWTALGGGAATTTRYEIRPVGCLVVGGSTSIVGFVTILDVGQSCGSATVLPYLTYIGTTGSGYFLTPLPGLNGAVTAVLAWESGATSTSYTWQYKGGCRPAGTATIAYNTAQSVTVTSPGTINQIVYTTLPTVNFTGCTGTDNTVIQVNLTSATTGYVASLGVSYVSN